MLEEKQICRQNMGGDHKASFEIFEFEENPNGGYERIIRNIVV